MEWTINDARQLPQTSIWRYGASGGAGGREINTDRITRNIARIVKLGIRHGSSLYAITVHFRRLDGVEDFYHLGGGGEHHPLTEINFDENEYITVVRGCISHFEGEKTVSSIEIETNNFNFYGPYGADQEHSEVPKFEFRANGGQIISFHGRSGSLINAIGVYVKDEWLSNINVHQLSPTLRKIGPCGCTRGGEREMDHMIGGIARIFKLGIRHWQAVDAIVIFFQRFDDTEGSYCFGGQKGEMTEINFHPNKYVLRVKGKIGYVSILLEGDEYKNPSQKVVRSIEIYPNFCNYGPYCVDEGTDFHFQAHGGQIIGFHERDVPWVYAIGVYVQ